MTARRARIVQRRRRPRSRGRAIGLLAVLLAATLAACSGSTPTAPASTGTVVLPALGGTAATTASCASSTGEVNAQAMVPGAARDIPVRAAASSGESLWSIATFLAQGAAAFLTGPSSLVGWAMNELGGAGSGGPDQELSGKLDQLSGQLTRITDRLNTIEGQLNGVTNLIKDSTYETEIKQLTENHVAPILSMWQQYCDIVATGDTDSATLDQLTNDVLDSATGIRPHVIAIAQTFQGSSETGNFPLPGMFAQFVLDQNLAGEFDDTVAYTKYMQPYTEYFASLAVMGMTLMVEAYHQRGDIKGAESALNDLWADVRTIYQAGGSPVSDANIVYQIGAQLAWTRKPVCVTAGFDSTQAAAFNEDAPADADPAQVALAMNTVLVASTPAAGQDGWNTPSYVYGKGDPVCAMLLFEVAPAPDAFMPALIADNPYLAQAAVSRSGEGWRDAGKSEFGALVAGAGDGQTHQYLTANGFVLPSAGATSVSQLGYGFWKPGDTGFFDPDAGSFNCLGAYQCDTGQWVAMYLVKDPECWLGTAEYLGLPTSCGTAWLDKLWAATPPPPTPVTPTSSGG